MRFTICLLAGLVVLLAGSSASQAQNLGGGGGGGGGTGGGATGGNLFGGGGDLFGGAGAATGTGTSAANGFSMEAFSLNQTTTTDQGFVGRDSADTNAFFNSLNQTGNEFLNQLERSMGTRNRGRGVNQATDARPAIRVNLKLGFKAPATRARDLAPATGKRLNLMLADKGFGAVAALEEGVAVLTGSVETDGERMMLERLARLEPGVVRVDNRLLVTAGDGEGE